MKLSTLLIFTLILNGCVSLGLPKEKIVKDENIVFNAPPNPYQRAEDKHVDRSWRNHSNGNTISFMSDCSQSTDPAHKYLQADVLSGLLNSQYEYQHFIDFNGRKALESVATGTVDGVASKVKLITLKKNNCIYILTYVALATSFDADLKAFDKFKQDFVAKGQIDE